MQKLFITSALSIGMLAGCSLLATQPAPIDEFQAEQAWQSVADPLIQSGTLANGMDWYVKSLPDNGARDRVELRLRIRSGSLVETDSELGLAHFVEHMAFNGTERFPKQDIVEFFEAAGMSFGGDINAHTSFEETVYKLTIPVDQPELIDTAFNVMYDWATAISFAQDEVSKEAPVVIEEWRSRFGTEEQSWLQEYKDVYEGTRILNRLPIGDKDIVASANAEQLKGYYQKWYRPDNAEFVVVYPEGAFDAPTKIGSVFNQWQAEPTPEVDFTVGNVVVDGARFKAVTDSNVTSQSWQLYLPVKNYGSESALAREVDFIDQIYTTVLAARLQRLGEVSGAAIIDAGAATSEFYEGTKRLEVSASVYEGKEVQALTDLTVELNRFKKYGITASEFASAKKKFLVQNENVQSWLQGAKAADHANYLMYFLSEDLALEDIDAAVAESQQMAEVVTLDKVNRYIAQTIESQNLAAYFYHPKTTSPDSEGWPTAYNAAWQQAVSAPVEKETQGNGANYEFTGAIAQQIDLTEAEGLTIWVLENGIPVILKHTDLEPGRVIVRTRVFGGNRQLDDDLIAASDKWREVRIRSGFEGQSGQDFFDSLELDGIGYSAFIEDGYSGADLSGQAEHIERMFKLTMGTFSDEMLNDQMIELTLNSGAEQAVQFAETPYFNYLSQYLPAVYGDDVRYAIFNAEDMLAITKEELLAVQDSLIETNQGAVIVIVGDVTPEQVTPLLKRYVAGFPLPSPSASKSLGPVTAENAFIRVAGQAEEKTDIRYVYAQTDLPVDTEQYVISEVMIEALDKRLHNAIREDSGLTYGTSVFQRPQYHFEQQWLLHVRMSTDPTREEEALTALDSTLNLVIESPFTEQEVTEANHRVLEQYKQAHSTNSGIIGELLGVVMLGGDVTQYNDYEAALSQVTTGQVNELATQLLNGKKVVAVHHP